MTKKSKKNMLKSCALLGILFLASLGLLLAFNALHKDRAFSETENRMLEQRPVPTAESVLSGRFMTKFEKYQTDQFAFRDLWVKVKTTADLILGKRESNGVYLGKDGYLLEACAYPDSRHYPQNVKAIQSFARVHPSLNISMIVVPYAAAVLTDKLPSFAPVPDQKEMLDKLYASLETDLTMIDVYPALYSHREEELYYRTDHHWTTLGAFYAFSAAAGTLGISPEDNKNQFYPVTEDFKGTLASRSGYYGQKDTISVYLPQEAEKLVVHYVEEQKKSASLYVSSKLDEKDKYAVFLGGNYPLVDIRTESANERRLLLIKDSYANCFVPFLTPYYREIVMVDPRYYYGDIAELIGEKQISDVLFLYNANTFFEDNSLHDVLNRFQ